MLTLALGIGASTAIFSVVSAVLLRPLPYPESDRLVRFIEHLPPGTESLGYPQRLASIRTTDIPTFRSQLTTLSHVGTYDTASMILAGRGEPLRVDVTLVVAEISLAMPLLVAGGLLTRSFNNLTHVDPGYDPGDVLTFTVASVGTWTPSTFNDEFVARVNTLPGVQAVGYAAILPMARFRSGGPLRPAQPVPGIEGPSPIDFRFVSRDFLGAMGMRIVEGRGFAESDGADAPRLLLINRALARSGYLGPTPIGTRVYPTALNVPWEIIGIVDDVRQYGLDQEPDAQVFIDARQLPMGNPNPYFAVRAGQEPMTLVTDIRAIARQLNPAAMMDNIATMEQVVSNSLSRPRLYAVLFGIFAAIAGGLAAIGVYGIIALTVGASDLSSAIEAGTSSADNTRAHQTPIDLTRARAASAPRCRFTLRPRKQIRPQPVTSRHLHLECLMRPVRVVAREEVVEPGLLLEHVRGGRLRRFSFQCEMHALMPSVLL